MNLRKNRRLNPRTGTVIFGWLFVGILAAALFLYGWSHFAMTETQRQCFSLYVQASFPLGKTVSRNAVHQVLGENVDPRDKSRVAKAPIYRTLHDLTYGGKSLPEIVRLPAEIAGGIVLLSLIVGGVRANKRRRELENGITLRGSKRVTIKDFNWANRGSILERLLGRKGGMSLEVYEFED